MTLTDEVPDQIDIGTLDMAYNPPAIERPTCAAGPPASPVLSHPRED